MVVLKKALSLARSELVEDTKKFIWGSKTRPVMDLTGIVAGVIALEDSELYNVEENVGRATTKIDLGIDLYDMEGSSD